MPAAPADYTVAPYQPGDEQGLLDLFNDVFGEGNPAWVPRPMAVWKHAFLDHPLGTRIQVAKDGEGRVIGTYSALPALFSVRGEQRPCVQGVDTSVRREWRGMFGADSVYRRAVHSFVARWCEVEGPDHHELLFGVPNRPAFAAGARVYGLKAVHRPLLRTYREFDARWVDELAARAGQVTVTAGDFGDVDALADLWDVDAVPLGPWIDATYLAWRYRDWPERPYHIVEARRDGQLVGALVYCLGWQGHPIVPLVEWLGDGADVELWAALLAHVGALTLEKGGRRLETWVSLQTSLGRTLGALGMQTEPTDFMTALSIYSRDMDLDFIKRSWVLSMGQFDLF